MRQVKKSSCFADLLLVLPQEIYADLTLPAGKPLGLVVFAHGSGSGRKSSRNRFVAEELRKKGSATLLADLLSKHEEDKVNCLDIEVLMCCA